MKRLAGGLLLSAATLVALALLFEAGLRAFRIGEDAIAGPHPWTGWFHLPNLRTDLAGEDPADRIRRRFETNALGFRDPPRTVAKPAGSVRVLLLGDSFVAGAEVPANRTLAAVMERALAESLGRPVEVWNCGVSGYSAAQELLLLRHVLAGTSPDVVVLGAFAANDVADGVPALATSLANRPFFEARGESLVLDRSRLRPDLGALAGLRRHSRAFGWLTTKLRTVRRRAVERRNVTTESGGIPAALMVYAARPDSTWDAAWRLTERLVLEIRDEARRQGAAFVLLSIPSAAQVHAEAREGRAGWERWGELPGLSLDEPDRRLAALAARESLEFVPLLAAFQDEAARTREPLYVNWFRHWNARGHALAGRVAAARVRQAIAAPR